MNELAFTNTPRGTLEELANDVHNEHVSTFRRTVQNMRYAGVMYGGGTNRRKKYSQDARMEKDGVMVRMLSAKEIAEFKARIQEIVEGK